MASAAHFTPTTAKSYDVVVLGVLEIAAPCCVPVWEKNLASDPSGHHEAPTSWHRIDCDRLHNELPQGDRGSLLLTTV